MQEEKKINIISILVSGTILLVGTILVIVYAFLEVSRIFNTEEEFLESEIMKVTFTVIIIVIVTITTSAIGYMFTNRRLKRRKINE